MNRAGSEINFQTTAPPEFVWGFVLIKVDVHAGGIFINFTVRAIGYVTHVRSDEAECFVLRFELRS